MKSPIREEWAGEDAFIIGGGSSLRTFEFPWLGGRNVIGVNDAFRLGPDICRRAIFSDDKYWKQTKWDLEEYAKKGGIVYSLSTATKRFDVPWLWQLERGGKGLSKEPEQLGIIGWNHNTGSSALNLALLMGAKRIFLLGFDMTDIRGSTHWHNYRPAPTPVTSFNLFLHGFSHVLSQMVKFPGREVFNVTDGSSKLPGFPRVTVPRMKGIISGFKEIPA